MKDTQKLMFIGRAMDDVTSLTELILYLAYYAYHGKPFFEVIESALRK